MPRARLAAPPAFALDLIGEDFGNAPFRGGTGLTNGLLSLLNDTDRVYLYHVESDGFKSFISGYFQGDTSAAHDYLRRFAALEKGLEVVLLPGPREVTSLDGKRKVSADWELHIPCVKEAGLRPDRRPVAEMKPTLYLYVRAPDRSAVPATPAQVARWLAGLDAEEFEDRERAFGELKKQGPAVTAALRKALKGKPPAEAGRRIGLLLARLDGLPGVNLGVLDIPEGVRVLGPDELLARNREALKSENVRAQGEVAALMTRFGPDPAALETLIQMVEDKQVHARQHAVRVLGRMGKAAAPALPALRAGLDDPVPYISADCKSAIAAIEAAKDEPDAAERAEKAKVVREEIGRFLKERPGQEKGTQLK
jgi:hypothetical protein